MIHIVLIVAGLVLLSTALRYGLALWNRRGWHEIQAEVIYSDIRPMQDRTPDGYFGVCILTYMRGDRKFIGQLQFARGSAYDKVQAAAQRYHAGSRHRILVREDDSERVMLQSVHTADTRLAFACAALSAACVTAAFTWFRNA